MNEINIAIIIILVIIVIVLCCIFFYNNYCNNNYNNNYNNFTSNITLNPNNLLNCENHSGGTKGKYNQNYKMCKYVMYHPYLQDPNISTLYCKGKYNRIFSKTSSNANYTINCTTSLTKKYPYLCTNGLACSSTIKGYPNFNFKCKSCSNNNILGYITSNNNCNTTSNCLQLCYNSCTNKYCKKSSTQDTCKFKCVNTCKIK